MRTSLGTLSHMEPRAENLVRCIVACAASATIIVGALAAPAAASTSSVAASPSEPDDEAAVEVEASRITLPLDHPTDLGSAVAYGATLDEQVLSYAFDNGSVVGEFAPRDDFGTVDYLSFFNEQYGTEPAVVGIVIAVSGENIDDKAAIISESEFGTRLPTVDPAPPVPSHTEFGTPGSEQGGIVPLTAGDWRPDASSHHVMSEGSSAMFASRFSWTGGGLYSLPNEVGLEFEINQDNPNVFAPQNQRPLCLDSAYKDRFWAKNYNWTWSVSDNHGSSVSRLGAYADYNDLSDLCRTNSIAIGLRYPKNLVGVNFPGGVETTLDVFILAPRGTVSSSKISGNVQAVSARTCNYANVSNTDCMGVAYIANQWSGYPAGTYNRATLGASRNIFVPSHCWRTWNKGANYASEAC